MKMIKRLTPLFLMFIAFSCNSAKVKKGNMSHRDLNSMDYTGIFYSFDNEQESTSRAGSNIIKYNNHALDSIFGKDANKFKIRNKIDLEKDLTSDFVEGLISASEEDLNSAVIPKLPFKRILLEKNTKFMLIPYIKPSIKLVESYASQNSILVTEPYSAVRSFELKILILDVAKNNISLYGSKKIRLNKGLSYGQILSNSLNEIFEEFNKE